MELYNFNDYEKIYLFGDIHGEFERLMRTISNNSVVKEEEERYYKQLNIQRIIKGQTIKKLHNKLNNSIIIVAGDCGFGFNSLTYYENILTKMNKLLNEIHSHLIFVRGNHDDPTYYDGKVINYSNIIAIPDYSVLITANENILCVGGAISIDRSWRITQEQYINRYKQNHKKPLYWSNEKPIYNIDELNKIVESNININFVVTHSAPDFINTSNEKNLLEWVENDAKLIEDVKNERNVFTSIYNYLISNGMELKGWFYSHFHDNSISNSPEQIPFMGLDCAMHFRNIYEIFNDISNDRNIKKFNAFNLGRDLVGRDLERHRFEFNDGVLAPNDHEDEEEIPFGDDEARQVNNFYQGVRAINVEDGENPIHENGIFARVLAQRNNNGL